MADTCQRGRFCKTVLSSDIKERAGKIYFLEASKCWI